MSLTETNYYSSEMSKQYFSVSQVKQFMACEAAAMAQIKGEWQPERGRALILGSYVDEMLTGSKTSQNKFIYENRQELFKKNGEPYADIQQADEAIECVKKQPLMLKYLDGIHQVIMTGEIEGCPIKGKFDSYAPGQFLADLKYLKDFRSPKLYENPITYYGYDLQLAVYRELIRQNTGDVLSCYLVIVTKQSPPDCAVVEVNSFDLDAALEQFKKNIKRYQAIKDGKLQPERCESHDCKYCRETKQITEIIDSSLLGLSAAQIKAMQGEFL